MGFNLLTDPFIPARTRDGGTRVLTIMDLPAATDALDPAWPRADFNAATMELLIGVASLALQPADDNAWATIWEDRPSDWHGRLDAFASAFELLGDGPRFLQEHGGLNGEAVPIEALLIDTPGANGQKKNADLLTHRARYPALGLPAAAMALYTLQAYAPAGGAGNQTSMRGGGPLSTLVIPQPAQGGAELSLWHKVWANVLPVRRPVEDIATVCPWMRKGVVAGKISQPTDGDRASRFHPLHMFFGMPRRLWLLTGEGRCALNRQEGSVVTGFVQKPKGHDYAIWNHVLTPYRRQKEGAEPYTAKPSSARFRAGDWIAAAIGDPPLRNPAAVVREIDRRIEDLQPTGTEAAPKMRVSGWNMNNMEATDWLSAEEPLYLTGDQARDAELATKARMLAGSADEAATAAVFAVKRALFGETKENTGKGELATTRSGVLDAADDGFHAHMGRALAGEPFGSESASWRKLLLRAALHSFDTTAPVPLDDPLKAARVVMARRNLLAAFGERSKAKNLKQLLPEKVT
jgi:CRISPR system Cascade subunit CasA